MNSTGNWLVHNHSEQEELLFRCQEAVEVEDWESANLAFRELIMRLKSHIELEEEVLYPAYESRVEAPQQPTESLREEHSKIVQFIRDMNRLFASRNSDSVLECLARLENLMIKHHEKEEDIFLPMAGSVLEAGREELLQKMNDFDASKSNRKWEI